MYYVYILYVMNNMYLNTIDGIYVIYELYLNTLVYEL